MKIFWKRLICLFRGHHKWEVIGKRWEEYIIKDEQYPQGVTYWEKIFKMKCTRCGKIKEEVM